MSSRTPIFRGFPRVGIPPHYGTWETYAQRVEMMIRSGAIDDYTYLWWDVRPHPKLGTVETRVFDQQTLLADTAALAALTITNPKILIMDEPTNQLDLKNRALVERTMAGLEQDLVVITHDLPLLESFDRVLLFHQNRLHADASPADAIRLYRELALT